MIVVADVGNTAIKAGLFDGAELIHTWRAPSTTQGISELAERLKQFVGAIEGACFCSVVPSLSAPVSAMLCEASGREVLEITEATPMPIQSHYRGAVGVDRLVAAVGALVTIGAPAIVVNVGTAITVDALGEDHVFLGGAIWASPTVIARALSQQTAALPQVEIEAPVQGIPRTTHDAIRAGLMLGAAGGIDRLVTELRRQIYSAKVIAIATGGGAPALLPLCNEVSQFDEHLTLRGLHTIWERGRSLPA